MIVDIQIALVAALGSIGLALLMGKAVRRILLLPFQKIAARTENKDDDVIVEEAARDLGIEDKTDVK